MDLFGDLWSRVLGEIEIEVSRANFLTLFKKTQLVSIEDGVATIAVPSNMIIDLLKRRYSDIIKKALDKHTKQDIKIVFVSKFVTESSTEPGPLFESFNKEQKMTVGHLPRVRSDYTFENMAVSGSNQLAFVSANSVAKKLGGLYNPLFVYGPTGVGKTHLMQAIANDVYRKTPDKKIVYQTSEEFTNEVVDAIRTNSTGQLKRKFRNLDLLIIDDVQFLSGKEKVQEELFHTFNILVDKGAQVVFSSDRHPSELKGMEQRLLSRFAGGLTVDIDSPDLELRCAILLIKSKKFSVDLPIDAARVIAQNLEDARQLEGALLRIITQAEAEAEEITAEFAQSVLLRERQTGGFHPDDLIKDICSFYNIKPTQIKNQKRTASLVRARQVAMYLLKKELGLTYVEIGNLLGGRDHTTVMHGVEKIENLFQNPNVPQDILGITKKLSVVNN
jgi:chromosomal replication initiator protein